jgi:hypothetical protein
LAHTEPTASCEITTARRQLAPGESAPLAASGASADGRLLGRAAFGWTSSDPEVVTIDGSIARGGSRAGSAVITARSGMAECQATFTNTAPVAPGTSRVIVVREEDGEALPDAELTAISAGSRIVQRTDRSGQATFALERLDALVITAPSRESFALLMPESRDLLVPLARAREVTRAGGFRGYVDLESAPRGDVKLAYTGALLDPAPTGLGESFGRAFCDYVETTVDAPELGIDRDTYQIPGGFSLSIGSNLFTGEDQRCPPVPPPSSSSVGCHLARAGSEVSGGWTLGVRASLSEVSRLGDRLSGAIGVRGCVAAQWGFLPLMFHAHHGAVPLLTIPMNPKANRSGQSGDCANPDLPNYDEVCGPAYDQFVPLDLGATESTSIHSRVSVPILPEIGGGARANAVMLTVSARIARRGYMPLGISSGFDVIAMEPPDGIVAGMEEPFGVSSSSVPDGAIALSIAPRHSGLEKSALLLSGIAISTQGLEQPFSSTSEIHRRIAALSPNESLGAEFLPFPGATFEAATKRLAISELAAATGLLRVRISRGGRAVTIFAPRGRDIVLPDVPAIDSVLGPGQRIVVSVVDHEASMTSLIERGSEHHWLDLASEPLLRVATRELAE